MPVLSNCRSREQIRVKGGVETERSGGCDFFNVEAEEIGTDVINTNTTRYRINTKISNPYDPNRP